MLPGLLYGKYRQQRPAKCGRADIEPILIEPANKSMIAAVKYAARRGWRMHAAAASGITGRKLSERLPAAGRTSMFQCEDAMKSSGYLQGKSAIAAGCLEALRQTMNCTRREYRLLNRWPLRPSL
ncbi:hypothetical protein ACTMU2_17920 [Cupriavidus basilensis]